ncbi:MAG: hypothetical protein Tsb0019_21760 [Roseibium sp.]
MFWTYFAMPHRPSTRTRLQDLDARMTTFLAEKRISGKASPEVLDNVKAARSKVQQEMAAAPGAS